MKIVSKLIVLLVIVGLVAAGWGYDSLRARTFDLEIVEVDPDPGIADGQTPVSITVKATRAGEPCAGHVLYAASANGGSFKAKRVTTGGDGTAVFIYYPYLKSKLNTLTDVSLHIADESNSVFVSVPVRTSLVLKMVEADQGGSDKSTNESIFG